MKKQFSFSFAFLFLIVFTLPAQVSNYNFKQYQGAYVPVATQGAFHLYYWGSNVNYADDTMHYGSNSLTKFRGLPIGFNFVFDADTQNVFGISSCGYLVLGKDSLSMYPPSSAAFPISGNGVYNILSPLGGGFVHGAIKIKYETLGISPNRVLTVQWENLSSNQSNNTVADRDSLDFQVKLFEAGNKIQFVYGPMQWCSLSSNAAYQVGIKGNSNVDFYSRLLLDAWDKTVTAFNPSASCRLNKKIHPSEGTVFEFNPPPASCD
ncbi:MAG: hypothetical protein ABUT20_65690, partial [Bacteroidota bacterium]